jgi:hypothetical protein
MRSVTLWEVGQSYSALLLLGRCCARRCFLYTFSAIFSPLHPLRWVGGSDKVMRVHTSQNFVFRTFTHLAGDGWSCSLQEIFCDTQNRHVIPCSPPTLVLWSGQPSALGVVPFVCVCVCVCLCLCVFSASASLCCHTALLPLPRQRLRLGLVVYVLLSPGEPSLEGLHFGPSCSVRAVCQRNSRHPPHRYLLLAGIALCTGDRSCIAVSNSGTYVIHAFVLPRHARRVRRGDDPHSDVYAATTLVGEARRQTLPPVDL